MKVYYYVKTESRKDPEKDGLYLCLTLRNNECFCCCLEIMNYEKGFGFNTLDGYYFDDDFGHDLIWCDVDIDHAKGLKKLLKNNTRVAIKEHCFEAYYLHNLNDIEII